MTGPTRASMERAAAILHAHCNVNTKTDNIRYGHYLATQTAIALALDEAAAAYKAAYINLQTTHHLKALAEDYVKNKGTVTDPQFLRSSTAMREDCVVPVHAMRALEEALAPERKAAQEVVEAARQERAAHANSCTSHLQGLPCLLWAAFDAALRRWEVRK